MKLSWQKTESEKIPGIIGGSFQKDGCCLVFQSSDEKTQLILRDCRLKGITKEGILIRAYINEPNEKEWHKKKYVYKDFYFV